MPSKPPQLNIIYYIESGCLGSDGQKKIADFCQFLTHQLNNSNAWCLWQVQELTDIGKHHFEYNIIQKTLNKKQAKLYLEAINKNIEHFEDMIDESVMDFIDVFLGR